MEGRISEETGASCNSACAGSQEWVGLAVLALSCLAYSLDLTVLNLALPALSDALQPTAAQLLWIVDIYGFVSASALITMGAIGDRIGRRRLLLFGAASFGSTSICAAFCHSAESLIIARAVMGVSGATLAPAALSLIRSMFHDATERGFAIGVWLSSYSIGAGIGPILGGVLLQHLWWGSVFLVCVPVMLLLLLAGPYLLPEYRDSGAHAVDLLSSLLSLVAILATIFGLKRIAEHGLSVLPLLSISGGFVVARAFLRRQFTLKTPMLDIGLFHNPAFTVALAAYGFGTFIAFGSFILVGQFMQLVVGLSPLKAALWTVPIPLALTLGSAVTPLLLRLMAPGTLIVAGLSLAAFGFVLLSGVMETTSPSILSAFCCIYCVGLAPVFNLATNIIVCSALPERAGAAAAISETSSEFGGALGIAILGSIATAAYRLALSNAIRSLQLPELSVATLDTAVQTAQQLGGPAGAFLLGASRAAFVQGLRDASIASAALAIVTATAVARYAPTLRLSDSVHRINPP